MMDRLIDAIWNSQGEKLCEKSHGRSNVQTYTNKRSKTKRQGCPAGSTYILDAPRKAQVTRLQEFTREVYMSLNKQNGQPSYLVSSHSEWPCTVHCMLRGRASGLANGCCDPELRLLAVHGEIS